MTLESENKSKVKVDVNDVGSGLLSKAFHALQDLWQDERRRYRIIYGSQELARRFFIKEQKGMMNKEVIYRRLSRLDAFGYWSDEAWITYHNLSVDAMMKGISSTRKPRVIH